MQNQHVFFLGESQAAGREKQHVILPPPKVKPVRDVFALAVLEESSAHKRHRAFDWIVAIGVHGVILAALLILPLYFTTGLNFQKVNLTYLAPLPPLAAPPPAPLTPSAAPRPARIAPVRVFTPGQLTAPTFIPKSIVATPGNAEAPPDEALMGVPGGVTGGVPGGQVGGVLGGVLNGVPPPATPVAEGPKVPVHVGGNVRPPRLLFGPEPEYPVLAREARLSGVVVIEAVIDEHGKVTGMRAISGQPMLISAALSAVSKRRYEPTVLDGEPTPIDLRVEVSFRFS
jgi:periplasmic protein TonB